MNIYKYQLKPGEERVINCIEVLSVIEQGGDVMVYITDDKKNNKPFRITVVGTGWERPPLEAKFLGTVKCGPYVWHAFYSEVNL